MDNWINSDALSKFSSVPNPMDSSNCIIPFDIFKLFETGSAIRYWFVILRSQLAWDIAWATCEIAKLAILVSATFPDKLTFSPSSFALSPHLKASYAPPSLIVFKLKPVVIFFVPISITSFIEWTPSSEQVGTVLNAVISEIF